MNKFKKLALLSVLSCSLILPAAGFAKDLGIFGNVYPIAEPDLLQTIYLRLADMQKNGDLQTFKEELQEKVQDNIDRPAPVAGITRALNDSDTTFDPSTTFAANIVDNNGNVIVPAGTTINPLDHVQLNEVLIFYNADDPDQVAWAASENQGLTSQGKRDKLIMVGGSVLSQINFFHKRVYFDQGGFLTSRFHITEVPALVQQVGNKLLIQERAP